MNSTIRTFLGLALLAAPFATGCARTAPFDQMDQAQITVMRLTTPPPVAQPSPVTGQPGFPGLPIPPELQAGATAVLQGAQAAGIPIPPGLIPGQPGPVQTAPTQPPPPMFNGLAIVASVPLSNEDMKNDLLDVFGKEDSFQDAPPSQCPTAPGMGISMVRPGQPNVDLLVSFSCSKAFGVGFPWPYKKDTLTTESTQKLGQIHQALFGVPVAPGS
ncbi:MAG: hypothetical protein IPM54_28450 [Polyangiaceae bacterium]|nr:hypothetical protein [Polyangiaceae bacterium]